MKWLMILVVLVSVGCKSEVKFSPTMHVYGDSIDKGYVQNPFVNQIASALGILITNNSVGSTSMFSPNQYSLIMSESLKAGDYVIFDPGVNDASYYGSDPTYLAQYKAGLMDVLNHWSKNHVKVYMITTLTLVPGHSNATNDNINIYAQITRDLVAQVNDPNIRVMDFNKLWTPTLDDTLDGVHPNQAGNDYIAKVFLSNL